MLVPNSAARANAGDASAGDDASADPNLGSAIEAPSFTVSGGGRVALRLMLVLGMLGVPGGRPLRRGLGGVRLGGALLRHRRLLLLSCALLLCERRGPGLRLARRGLLSGRLLSRRRGLSRMLLLGRGSGLGFARRRLLGGRLLGGLLLGCALLLRERRGPGLGLARRGLLGGRLLGGLLLGGVLLLGERRRPGLGFARRGLLGG